MADLSVQFAVAQSKDGDKVRVELHAQRPDLDPNESVPLFGVNLEKSEAERFAFALLGFDQEMRETVQLLMKVEDPDDEAFIKACEEFDHECNN